jgi:hypothetical protein
MDNANTHSAGSAPVELGTAGLDLNRDGPETTPFARRVSVGFHSKGNGEEPPTQRPRRSLDRRVSLCQHYLTAHTDKRLTNPPFRLAFRTNQWPKVRNHKSPSGPRTRHLSPRLSFFVCRPGRTPFDGLETLKVVDSVGQSGFWLMTSRTRGS